MRDRRRRKPRVERAIDPRPDQARQEALDRLEATRATSAPERRDES